MIDPMVMTTGIFIGICIALIGTIAFIYITRRKGILEVRIAPEDPRAQSEQASIDDLYTKVSDLSEGITEVMDMAAMNKRFYENLDARMSEIEKELAPYLKKKE